MEKICFTKMSGAGNDFIILKDFPADDLNSVLIKTLCDRRNGIGADGVITITGSGKADFSMNYYNADGSTGSLCGNGARCAIKFADTAGFIKDKRTRFFSGNTEYSGEVLEDGRIKFNLNPPVGIRRNFKIDLAGKDLNVFFTDTGSPHVIVYVEELEGFFGIKYSLDEIPVEGLGREIRYHTAFSPGGTNVNFLHVEEGKIKIRTYERGVEDETFACGTGSVAAAIISFLENRTDPPVQLITRSGEKLEVNFRYEGNRFSEVSLTGPAEIIFTGEYST